MISFRDPDSIWQTRSCLTSAHEYAGASPKTPPDSAYTLYKIIVSLLITISLQDSGGHSWMKRCPVFRLLDETTLWKYVNCSSRDNCHPDIKRHQLLVSNSDFHSSYLTTSWTTAFSRVFVVLRNLECQRCHRTDENRNICVCSFNDTYLNVFFLIRYSSDYISRDVVFFREAAYILRNISVAKGGNRESGAS